MSCFPHSRLSWYAYVRYSHFCPEIGEIWSFVLECPEISRFVPKKPEHPAKLLKNYSTRRFVMYFQSLFTNLLPTVYCPREPWTIHCLRLNKYQFRKFLALRFSDWKKIQINILNLSVFGVLEKLLQHSGSPGEAWLVNKRLFENGSRPLQLYCICTVGASGICNCRENCFVCGLLHHCG